MEMDTTNPEAAVAKGLAVSEEAKEKVPEAPEAPDDVVELPGGLVKGDSLITHAVVRELTGDDEEKLSRAAKSGNQFHFMNVLLECGTVQLGDEDPAKTKSLLMDLLVGDRDQLLLGIRNVTYGPDLEIIQWRCPSCQKLSDLTLDLTEDIPQKNLEDRRADRTFKIDLRHGKTALCTLLTGHDQKEVTANAELTTAERNSVVLSKCIEQIEDPNGTVNMVRAWPSIVKKLPIPDRHKILAELEKRSPGPRYNEIKLTHNECGEEVTLALAIGDLFLL